MNRLVFIKRAMYRMKRRYGSKIRLLDRVSVVTDRATGVRTTDVDDLIVNRAIMLPNTLHREFFYDLTFIASNKNFTYGGHVGTTERRMILDRKDLRKADGSPWIVEVGQWFLYGGRRYEVKEVNEFEEAYAYMVTGKAVDGAPSDSQINVEVTSEAELDQQAEGEVTP